MGATYALVEVIPDAVGNGVIGTVCAVNIRSGGEVAGKWPRSVRLTARKRRRR